MCSSICCCCFRVDENTINLLYNDIPYNDKTRYNDNLNGTNPQLKTKRIIGKVKACT